jgi:ankyrin repeat protein
VEANPAIVETRCAAGRTPLHYAALGTEPMCVSVLAHSRLDAFDLEGKTPIFLAVESGPLSVVEQFLTLHGVSKQLLNQLSANTMGDTPLHMASRRKRKDVMSMLTTSGALADTINKAGALPSDVWYVMFSCCCALSPTDAVFFLLFLVYDSGGCVPNRTRLKSRRSFLLDGNLRCPQST